MFTTIDKALAAAFMSLVFLGKTFLDIDVGLSNEAFAGLLSVLTPVLIYFVPNLPWADKK